MKSLFDTFRLHKRQCRALLSLHNLVRGLTMDELGGPEELGTAWKTLSVKIVTGNKCISFESHQLPISWFRRVEQWHGATGGCHDVPASSDHSSGWGKVWWSSHYFINPSGPWSFLRSSRQVQWRQCACQCVPCLSKHCSHCQREFHCPNCTTSRCKFTMPAMWFMFLFYIKYRLSSLEIDPVLHQIHQFIAYQKLGIFIFT